MTDNLLQALAIIPEKFASENIGGMWATVITGMVVVFLILALLILLLWIISKLCNLGTKKAEQPRAQAEAASAPAPIEAAIEEENDDEVIAVISAAIAAYSESDGKSYAIKKIKRADKKPRSSWGDAGVNENTRPF